MKNTVGGLITVIVLCCGMACAQVPDVWGGPSTLLRIGQTDASGTGTTATLYGGRGEYVSFQVAVHAPADGLKKVNFSVSSLTGPGGAVVRNTSTNLILYRERYITVKRH